MGSCACGRIAIDGLSIVRHATRPLRASCSEPERPSTPPRCSLLLVYGAFLAIIGMTAGRPIGTGRRAVLDMPRSSTVVEQRCRDHAGLRQRLRATRTTSTPTDLTAAARTAATRAASSGALSAPRQHPAGRAAPAGRHDRRGQRRGGQGSQVAVEREFAERRERRLRRRPSVRPPEAAAGPGTFATADAPARVPAHHDRRRGARRHRASGVTPCRSSSASTEIRRDIVVVTLTAALVAAGLLYLIFRSAQARLTRQTAALLEIDSPGPADRAAQPRRPRRPAGRADRGAPAATAAPLGIALIDIDNFRLLNDNHGHEAGDQALLAVGRHPRRASRGRACRSAATARTSSCSSRQPAAVAALEPVVERLRAALVDISLQLRRDRAAAGHRVSVGIATYPDHASSVDGPARHRGPGRSRRRRRAAATPSAAAEVAARRRRRRSTTSFDVLQGLVIAVDTKDRYTKRHSEDVARYAHVHRRADSAWPRSTCARPRASRGCSTTWARSASPTRSCASRASSPRPRMRLKSNSGAGSFAICTPFFCWSVPPVRISQAISGGLHLPGLGQRNDPGVDERLADVGGRA